MRTTRWVISVFTLIAVTPGIAQAQSSRFEGKTVTIVVRFKTGGG